MAITKMNDLIYGPDGEVTTLTELADAGKLDFKQETVWGRKIRGERKERVAYFAYFKGTTKGYEIGKTAYLSRTGQGVNF